MRDPGAAIRLKARELGFDAVALSRAAPIAQRERFQDWLARGYQGEMTWLERIYRRDPGRLDFPVASIITVALDYFDPTPLPADPQKGKISRYARGDDYHDVLRDRLAPLVAFVEELGATARAWVDSSPLSEKAWAPFGWQGKHTNIIREKGGSWFFLGAIATDLELEPDARQAEDRCGSCTRCLTACPTGAIVAPYVVDARLCISYLTIELKGPIPSELRPLIGNHIFGCDDCQEVCPWNRFARPGALPPREENLAPILLDLLALDDAAFRTRFVKSPVRRPKRRGFLRNVCVALGNGRDPVAIPALTRALQDTEPLVRGHAAWALGQIGGANAALLSRLDWEADTWVHSEIETALSRPASGC